MQGGRCITHGAKRKQCSVPGCSKNVKKAGLCSAHGPARKKCNAEGCNKVAVRGGRCISHGAKRKTCAVPGCDKQSVLASMCKRHHDQYQQEKKIREQSQTLMEMKSGKTLSPWEVDDLVEQKIREEMEHAAAPAAEEEELTEDAAAALGAMAAI